MSGIALLARSLREFPPAVWFLCVGTLINRGGSFVLVFLVVYLSRLGHAPATAGFAMSLYGVGSLLAALAGGSLADSIGRRATIVISMVGAAVAMMALYAASSLPLIMTFSALTGFFAEAYRPASGALLADLTPPGQRVTAFALNRLAINVGMAFGPALGGLLAERSFLLLFLGDAITCLVFAGVALALLPRHIPEPEPTEKTSAAGWGAVLRDRPFVLLLLASVASSCVIMQLGSSLPLHVLAQGYTPAFYGMLLSLNGAMIVLFELLMTGWTQRFAPTRMIALGFMLLGVGIGIDLFAASATVLILAVFIWTIGEMVALPVAGAYVADLAPDRLRGRYMGAWSLSFALGLIIGPAAGTAIFEWNPDALAGSCAAIGVLSALLVLRSRTKSEPR